MASLGAMLTSARDDWQTPPALFAALDAEFRFTCDAAASADNALCPVYFTRAEDALAHPWTGRVWVNPPYGRVGAAFLAHAWRQVYETATAEVVVLLVAARTDTRAWHQYAMHGAEIRLIPGRLRFVGASASAPFPSAVLVFRRPIHPVVVYSWRPA